MLTVAPAQTDRGGRVLRDSGPAHSVSAQGLPWAPVFRAGPDPAVYAHTKVHMGRKPRAKRSWCGCIYCAVVRTRDSAPRSPHPLAGGGRTTLRAVCVCVCVRARATTLPHVQVGLRHPDDTRHLWISHLLKQRPSENLLIEFTLAAFSAAIGTNGV